MMQDKKNTEQHKAEQTRDENGSASGNRRKILKGMLAGGGAAGLTSQLPTTWTKPLVDSVLIPAHARTSQSLANMNADICFVGDSDWSGMSLDETPCYPFSSGDSNLHVNSGSDSQDISLFLVSARLDQAPGSSGTATVDVNSTFGSVSEDASYDANQTNIKLPVRKDGTLSGSANYTATVRVPGFANARISINISS